MGVLSGNPQNEPLHYGEIYAIWQASMTAKGCISATQALKFHTGDKDLRRITDDIIEQARQEASELDQILLANGIAPAPGLPERPEAKLEEIPPGARFSDPEISAMLSADTAVGLTAYSTSIGISIREDIAALFAKYHTAKTAIGGKLLKLSKEKGWLIPPPLQIKRPELVEV